MRWRICSLGAFALSTQYAFAAITIDVTNQESIKQAASQAAAGMVRYYTGHHLGDVPGNLPEPYYWWEAGAMFGALIDYWYFTGDDQYNNITMQAMVHQLGPENVFQPPNQTKTLGNDDQAFWTMAALSAAENKFPNPPSDTQASWLGVAQGVFNLQAARWNTETCGGGLKWQIFAFNNGYNYKNSISNGCFFNIGSRLAVYTGNTTYSEWAEKVWDWSSQILFDSNYNFYDGSDDKINCTELDHIQWTYNAGTFLVGAANMYNFTDGSEIWRERLMGVIGNLNIFLKENVMFEAACEDVGTCNVDQRSFKAYFARWMAATIVRAPFTREYLKPILEASAQAAVATCTGGDDGNQCGLKWPQRTFDGSTGVGEQMAVLEVVQSNLVDYVAAPATAETGISEGDPTAGTHSPVGPDDLHRHPMSNMDRAGAAIMTVMICIMVIGTMLWLVVGD
ncbi:mannan endo-1 [Exophiala xenobiotica]|uniref:Mannan endo-1,6-alpha-mannosidase n=1 Tax=Lithohypha guttulata TaxID=1690604 RepID=A0ABR0K7D5_9EURO|nr:mannan endo-1 [Lithohypha guttulata]KAK5317280.1 mannan endo-1 [Exophiala xenobiotica]